MTEATYDLLVVGAGSAGLSAAGFGVEMGARTALVERKRIGGDCTWSGCVPSKTLLKAAKVVHHMRAPGPFGLSPTEPTVDLKPVMDHVHAVIEETYAEESPAVMREKGIDVYLGEARFVDPHTLVVGKERVQARNVVLSTGAHPFHPPIEGLDAVDSLTYETLWDLKTLPEHLLVLGGGPIGSEMSQAFRRLGARVTLIEGQDRILTRDEPEASHAMMRVFEAEGIELCLGDHASRAWQDDAGIHLQVGEDELVGDALLVAVGRRPNVAGLDLERAGVAYSARGIEVDDHLRTSQRHIFAAGDCIGSYQFTHYAGWQATIAARNALLPAASKGVKEWVPWTTFTEPEVAHYGMMEDEARERYGDAMAVTTLPMTQVDRARAEVDREGFVKVVHKGGKALGVTIVSARAGELLQEWIHVLDGNLRLRDLTTIHVYPTYSRANVKSAGQVLQKQFLEGPLGGLVRRLGQWMLKLMRLSRGV
jgi:pyruvate/2-oxoglutarate dehydrogenase complex dihydrolipoamide dehydrogenase (E3) component